LLQADASTAFLRAARAGQIEKIISLLEQGVDINVSNAVSIISPFLLLSSSPFPLSSSSAHYSPLLDIGLSNTPFRSIFGYSHLVPASRLRKSSLHLARGRHTLHLLRRDLHFKIRLPHRLSVLWLIWPAHATSACDTMLCR
jgi:hypothetical protein